MNNNNTINNRAINPDAAKAICEDIKNRVQNGERVSLVARAKQEMITPKELREMLTEQFGNRVSFAKGRNGGIRIV